MSLFTEITNLVEGTFTSTDLVKLFLNAEDEQKLKTYRTSTVYEARPGVTHEKVTINGKVRVVKPGQVVVRVEGDSDIHELISKEGLAENYAPVRPHQKPDAEGFIKYISKRDVEAFQYEDDKPKHLAVGGKTLKFRKGDYLARYSDNQKMVFVMDPSDFEAEYTEQK